MVQNDWYLVTAEDGGVANTLTAAWGGLGNLCWKSTATVYIRPQRYTKKFMDASGRFTMTAENFTDPKVAVDNYPDKDFSEIYIVEIEDAYDCKKDFPGQCYIKKDI